MAIESADGLYHKMILESQVSTAKFHEVLGALISENTNEEAIEHMEYLLHYPDSRYAVEWRQKAINLAVSGMIATVSDKEVLEVWKMGEPPQEWDTLAKRVIEKRKGLGLRSSVDSTQF